MKISSASADGSTSGGGSHPGPFAYSFPTAIDATPPGALTPSSTTSSRAPEASSCRMTSASVRLGLTGVTVAPSRQHANNSTTNSTPVAQLERHHIAGTDTEFVEVTTCRSNTLQQPSIGQRPSPVGHRGPIGVEIGPSVG